MTDKETIRLYLTEELKDSTRGVFSLAQTSKDVGLGFDALMPALGMLVADKIISLFELQNPDDVFIELLL